MTILHQKIFLKLTPLLLTLFQRYRKSSNYHVDIIYQRKDMNRLQRTHLTTLDHIGNLPNDYEVYDHSQSSDKWWWNLRP